MSALGNASTRAARPFYDKDFQLVINTLGEEAAKRVFYDNAINFYRIETSSTTQA